jgi:hypothetical protein
MLEAMTFLDAAQAVLKSSGRAMTAKEITSEALATSLISTKGRTPVASMNAALYRAKSESGVRREFTPGPHQRAKRETVRWRYVSPRVKEH